MRSIRIALSTELHDRVWKHQSVVSSSLKDSILQHLESMLETQVLNNFENRIIQANGQSFKLIGTSQYRQYSKIWHLSNRAGYWDQTPETIVAWAETQYRDIMHPAVYRLMKTIARLDPFAEHDDWVVIRGIFNHLAPDTFLHGHIDFNEYEIQEGKRQYSASFYAKMPTSEGGAFWDETGFMHTPEENSVLINVGNELMHGVTKSPESRIGVTMRFVRAHDLILPGSVDKLLYRPE